jgi:cellulose synthase/poly-beta-1,6-N-acetylglucosamine synthase-like glycosyltransferase
MLTQALVEPGQTLTNSFSSSEDQKLHQDKFLVIVCAYNEESNLPFLLDSLKGEDVLVIDDGSLDKTQNIALTYGVKVISHKRRYGKITSLAEGISYAIRNSYDTVIAIDGDSIPRVGTLSKVLKAIEPPDVGAVSCKQIPLGSRSLSYFVDELIWAMLTEGKKLQMKFSRSCHLGAVLMAFRPKMVDSIDGSVNDDESVGLSIKKHGYRVIFQEDAVVYFDASTSIHHMLERRRRMYYGHMKYEASTAPSMNFGVSALALIGAVRKAPRRIVWTVPALVIEFWARFEAWKDTRYGKKSTKYSHWVTTFSKNNTFALQTRDTL